MDLRRALFVMVVACGGCGGGKTSADDGGLDASMGRDATVSDVGSVDAVTIGADTGAEDAVAEDARDRDAMFDGATVLEDTGIEGDAGLAADAGLVEDAGFVADASVLDAPETRDVPDAASGDGGSRDADLRGYSITTSSISFTALAAPTAIALAPDADDGIGSVAAPFPVELFGRPVTSLQVSPNGFAATGGLVAGGGASNTTFPSAAAPNGILAPWWEDLTIDPSISGGFAYLGWAVVGAAPNRQWIIEWRDARVTDHTRTSHRRFTFQLVLFETSQVIEYRYGETATVGDPATPASASVGLEDETGLLGQDVLGCTPICRGPPRPGTPMGFPRQTVIRMTPR